MLTKLFQHKVVGLSYCGENIKYALISIEKNTLIVNEAQTFNINCKAALHRLQHLLKSYPSCYTVITRNCLLEKPPKEIKSLKDRAHFVKNKIEVLLNSGSILTVIQKNLKGKESPSYLCIKKATIQKLLQQINELPAPQKVISISQALVTLDKFYTKQGDDGCLIYFDEKLVEIVDIKNSAITYHQTLLQTPSSQPSVIKKILSFLYTRLDLSSTRIKLHGSCKLFLNEIEKEEINNLLQICYSPYQNLEENYPDYLVEIGAALNLQQGLSHNFQKIEFRHIVKTYKKPLYTHTAITVLLLFLSLFYWHFKISSQEFQNDTLLKNSLSKLNQVNTYTHTSTEDSIHKLQKLIIEKQKNTPFCLFANPSLKVTDVVAWISSIYQSLQEESPATQFTIESLKYNYPIHDAKGGKNPQVKISLAFSADSSQTARKIYEKIIYSKQIVDTSQNVNWNYHNSQYQVSFYLKNKGKG